MTIQYIGRAAPFALDPAVALLGNEREGLAIDFTRDRAYNRDRVTAANNYLGGAASKFSVSRASDGSRYDAARVLRTDGPNVLRLTHDPITGKALGALLEGASTNRLTMSDDYRSNWSPGGAGVTITPDAAMAPDGTMTAQLVELLGPDGRVSQPYTGAASTLHTGTLFLRALPGEAGTWPARLNGEGSGATTDNKLVAINDQAWTRVSLNAVSGAGGIIRLFVGDRRDGGALTKAYVWRAQIEAASFASSPIKTVAAAAQRLADNLSFARSGTPEGTVVIEARTAPGKVASGSQGLFYWEDGTVNNRIILARLPAGAMFMQMNVDGSAPKVTVLDTANLPDNTDFKAAMSWELGRFSLSVNGAPARVSTSYAGPLPLINSIRIGTSGLWGGTVARVRLTPRATDPSELPGLLS